MFIKGDVFEDHIYLAIYYKDKIEILKRSCLPFSPYTSIYFQSNFYVLSAITFDKVTSKKKKKKYFFTFNTEKRYLSVFGFNFLNIFYKINFHFLTYMCKKEKGYLSVYSIFNDDYLFYKFDPYYNFNETFNLVFNHTLSVVSSILVNNDYIFIGGNFSFTVNGNNVNNFLVYKMDSSNNSNGSFVNVNGSTSSSPLDTVNYLLLYEDILYIGGYFTK